MNKHLLINTFSYDYSFDIPFTQVFCYFPMKKISQSNIMQLFCILK